MSMQIGSAELFKVQHANTVIQKGSHHKAGGAVIMKRKSKDQQYKSMKKKMAATYFENIEIKNLIKQLKEKGGIERNKLVSLIEVCQNRLKYEPNVLRVSSPLIIVGDIHGQFFDLLNIFQQNGFPDQTKFLFLGDYVDRGLFCIEVITLLMTLKVKYPENILLLRGNHEGRVMTMNFNFRLQCQKKYGAQIYEKFIDMFCKLPLCAVVDQSYFAVHGGISPEIGSIKQLERINRFVEISNHGIVCDLMWSDPAQTNAVEDWQPNKMRGCSYFYGATQTKAFLKYNKIKMIVRGHEVQIEGYSYQKSQLDQKLTLTIFSAPNYCDVYKNKGALAIIKDNKFAISKFGQVEHPFVLSNYMNCLEFSMPGVCQLVGKLLIYLLRNRHKSKKDSLSNDELLQELNALKRIEEINEFIEKKLLQNEFVMFETLQKEQEKQQSTIIDTSYKLSFEAFTDKKQNDEEEMYPDQKVLETIRQRKKTKKMTLIMVKSTKRFMDFELQQNKEVFGPKLSMRNNISKKLVAKDDEDEEVSEEY